MRCPERHRQRIYHQPKGPLAIADSPPRLAHHFDVGLRQGFSCLRIEHYAMYHDLGLGISRAVSQKKEGKPDYYYWRKHNVGMTKQYRQRFQTRTLRLPRSPALPILTPSLFSPLYCSYLAAAPIPQKPPSPTEAPTPMYGKRPLLNIRVAGALIAYQMLSGRR